MAAALSREELFQHLLDEWQAALQRLCAGYEYAPERRRELLQDILLALWRALPAFRGEASLRTWMYRIAHNVAASHASRSARDPMQKTKTNLDPLVECEPGPEQAVDRRRAIRQLHHHIRQLPPLDRQIILLYLEEVPQQDIAEIIGLSRDNISTRVHRIKTKLARAMEGVQS